MKERTSSIPDPNLHGFQHSSGLKADNTRDEVERRVQRGWANFKVKTYGLKKELFYFTL